MCEFHASRGPRASGRKIRGKNAGGGWVCGGAGGWGGHRSSVIMSSSDVRGLTVVGEMSPCGPCPNPSHLSLSLRRLIVLEMSDPESNSDSTGVGALGCLCASASLLIRSSSHCSLSTSSMLFGGLRWLSSSKTLVVHYWPSRKSSVCALTPSNNSRMRFRPGFAIYARCSGSDGRARDH